MVSVHERGEKKEKKGVNRGSVVEEVCFGAIGKLKIDYVLGMLPDGERIIKKKAVGVRQDLFFLRLKRFSFSG